MRETDGGPPVGPAILAGAAVGAIRGALVLALWSVVVVNLVAPPLASDLLGYALGLPIGGAVLGLSDAAWERWRGLPSARVALLLGGALAPPAAVLSIFTVPALQLSLFGSPLPGQEIQVVTGALGVGLALGVVQAVAARPIGALDFRDGAGWLVFAPVYFGTILVLPIFLLCVGVYWDSRAYKLIGASLATVAGLPLPLLLARGLGGSVRRAILGSLEPTTSDVAHELAREAHARHVNARRDAERRAAADPAGRASALEQALAAARAARTVAEQEPGAAHELADDVRHEVALLFDLGRAREAPMAVPNPADRLALGAEVARRAGDPASALEMASAALAHDAATATTRATAHAVMALAARALGQLDLARTALAEARVAQKLGAPFLLDLRAGAVEKTLGD